MGADLSYFFEQDLKSFPVLKIKQNAFDVSLSIIPQLSRAKHIKWTKLTRPLEFLLIKTEEPSTVPCHRLLEIGTAQPAQFGSAAGSKRTSLGASVPAAGDSHRGRRAEIAAGLCALGVLRGSLHQHQIERLFRSRNRRLCWYRKNKNDENEKLFHSKNPTGKI